MSETIFNDIDLHHFIQCDNYFRSNFNNEYFNLYSFTNYVINENEQLNNFEHLSLIHLNIRSIKSDFVSYLKTVNLRLDLICLSGTSINDDFLPDYKSFHSIRSGSIGSSKLHWSVIYLWIQNLLSVYLLKFSTTEKTL